MIDLGDRVGEDHSRIVPIGQNPGFNSGALQSGPQSISQPDCILVAVSCTPCCLPVASKPMDRDNAAYDVSLGLSATIEACLLDIIRRLMAPLSFSLSVLRMMCGEELSSYKKLGMSRC